jgi:lipopolysaccharide biosynthesis regulator YciM
MEFQYWWFLALPFFFGLGWIAARIDLKHLLSESRALPQSYFKGLNFLMNEQPDKAIEAFVDVIKVEPQTIELHFALGNLFRRRGEIMRAIKMHQSLLERDDLDEEQKLYTLFEIAQDYLKAGLLDRAEESFSKLEGTMYAESSLKFLLEIFEQEKDWLKAVATAERLAKLSGQSLQKEIANFYCELASQEMMNSKVGDARQHLDDALSVHRRCVRSNVLLGDLEAGQGRFEEAISAWKRIESQSPDHLCLVSSKMLDAFDRMERFEEGLRLLKGYLSSYPSVELLNVVFDAELKSHGMESAYHLVRDELRLHPSLMGLDRLLEAQLMEAPIERRKDLELIKNLVHQHAQNLAQYRCESCGFNAKQFYWHCPACGGWETFPPKQSEEK